MKFLAIIFSLLCYASAEASTIYVDGAPKTNCIGTYNVNTRNCTGAATSYATPNGAAAVATSASGIDTILFQPGTYTNPDNDVLYITHSGTASSRITYRAINPGTVILQGNPNPAFANPNYNTNQNAIHLAASWITLDGLNTLYGNNGIFVDGGGGAATDNIIKNNDVSFARGTGLQIYGGGSTRNFVGPNNIVHDNSQVNYPMGLVQTWGAGIFVGYGAYGNTVDSNVSYFNHGEGISTGTCCQNGEPGNDFFNNISSDNWSTNFYNDGANNSRMSGNFSYVSAEEANYGSICPPGAFYQCNGYLARAYQFSVETDAGSGATLQNVTFDHNIAAGFVNGCWQITTDADRIVYTNWVFYNNTCVLTGPIIDNYNSQTGVSGTINGMVFKNNIFEIGGGGTTMGQVQTGAGFTYYWDHNLWYGTGSFYSNTVPYNYAQFATLLGFTGVPAGTSPPNTSAGLVNSAAGASLPRLWGNQFGYGAGHPVSDAIAAKANFALATNSIAINKGTTQITGSTTGACASNNGGSSISLVISSFSGSCPDLGAIESGGVANNPPLIAFTGSNPVLSPPLVGGTQGAITSSASITVTGNSSDPGGSVASVSATCDSRCTLRAAGGTTAAWTQAVDLLPGINVATFTATDNLGTPTSITLTINYIPTYSGDALVLAYAFDEPSGTTATDSSGNKNDAVFNGAATRTPQGKFGSALSLDGSTGAYVGMAADSTTLHFTQSFTFSAWVNPSVLQTEAALIVKNYIQYLYAAVGSSCGASSNYIGITVDGGPGQFSACNATPPLPVGTWTHVAATYDSNAHELKLYRNGGTPVTIAATGIMDAITPPQNPLQIGASKYGEYFNGKIDEVRIYTKAIPQTAGANTVPNAPCGYADYTAAVKANINLASVDGDMNCRIIAQAPPLPIKFPASATGLKAGAAAAGIMLGVQ